METFLIKAAQLIVALAFLVIIHEFGHYIFARIFGIKVEKFYMFFDPYFSLFKWKPKPKKDADPNKTSWRDTEYGIGWLPWGVNPSDGATEGFDFVPAAQAVGFKNGDIPLMADGEKLDASQGDYAYKMADADVVTVLRNKKDTVNIRIPEDFIFRLNDDKGFLGYRLPVYIDRVVPGEAAAKAGLQEGDHIVAVDTVLTPTFTELTPTLVQYADKETTVTVERDGKRIVVPITPNEYGKLGFQLRPITAVYPTVTVNYGFFETFPKGWEIGTTTLGNYVSSMKHVFSSEGAQSLGGFGAIGNMFPEKWNWLSFWEITAFLSVVLAFMNIIPIPGLDGGHVMFLIWEIVTRRKPSEKVLIAAQYVGMAFLLLLLIYANGNDIFRAFLK